MNGMTTFYVAEQGAILAKRDERLLVRKNGQILTEFPLLNVEQIVVLGNAVLTTPLVSLLLNRGIPVSYLSRAGRYRGRLQPAWSQDASLRRAQHLNAVDPSFSLAVSRAIVRGKLLNMRTFMRRQRQGHRHTKIQSAVATLEQLARRLRSVSSLDELRGYEGAASAAYYRAFGALIHPDVARHLPFRGRSQRPPRDPVNAMMSLGYTLLYQEVLSAVTVVGFDPYCGFFHQLKHGHAALASDLAEEWRAILVDSTVLTVLNRREIAPAHFRQRRSGIFLTRDGLQRFLHRYEERMATLTRHPRLQSSSAKQERGRVPYRRCLELQARSLADCVLGRTEEYRPFRIR